MPDTFTLAILLALIVLVPILLILIINEVFN
jgi:hypothetical protein